MNDKPFDPVTEGTPEEFAKHIEGYYGISPETELSQLESDIAARDAAMRRKGLEEAAGQVPLLVEEFWKTLVDPGDGSHLFDGSPCKRFVLGQLHSFGGWANRAIRTAAETAKETPNE